MAKKGRAGAALGISAIGSFIGGTFGILMLTFFAPPLAAFALAFGPPEYFALIILGLTFIAYLSSGSVIKALMMASLGLLLGCIGTDLITGSIRFTLGVTGLTEGLNIAPVVMGLFGISEIMLTIERKLVKREFFQTTVKDLFPSKEEFSDSVRPIARGSILGFLLGVLPGGGTIIASIISYATEKRFSKHPEKFGTGYIAGVAGPETANNAASQGAFIPLLSLGIPGTSVMALLMGAFLIHGVTPGPLLLETKPDLFWGVVGSMYIGNIMLLLLNFPLIGIWVKVLKVPYVLLFPIILILCLIGSYSINNNILDLFIMIIFGLVGYIMTKFQYPAAPLILAFILGPMLEKTLGQSLMMSNGSFKIFVSRPISLTLLSVTILIFVSPLMLKLLKRKRPGLLLEGRDES